MTLDPRHLLSYSVPDVRQDLTDHAAAVYALSAGFGQDPLDTRQLPFVVPSPDMPVLPSMAVVLAHPGFWLGNPDTGVDALRLVHGEQEIECFRPLRVGDRLLGRTRVTGLVDKGPGRGALLYTEKHLVDGEGETCAITRATIMLRGDGGCGGTTGPVRQMPLPRDDAPDAMIDLATRPEQALLYRLNGDGNPLHSDPAVAERAGFPRPILHGLCTLSVVFRALLQGQGADASARFRSLKARFTAPVFPGETIRTELWTDGSFRARTVERDVVVVNNGHVAFTEASAP